MDWDAEGGLFSNDAILPEQFAEKLKRSERSPEQRLLWDVFEDAIHCVQLEPCNNKQHIVRHEAEMWIAGKPGALFSFVQVCDYLGIDAEVVRERLHLGRVQPLPKYRRAARGRDSRKIASHET